MLLESLEVSRQVACSSAWDFSDIAGALSDKSSAVECCTWLQWSFHIGQESLSLASGIELWDSWRGLRSQLNQACR